MYGLFSDTLWAHMQWQIAEHVSSIVRSTYQPDEEGGVRSIVSWPPFLRVCQYGRLDICEHGRKVYLCYRGPVVSVRLANGRRDNWRVPCRRVAPQRAECVATKAKDKHSKAQCKPWHHYTVYLKIKIGWRSPGGGSISWDWFGFWCKVYFCLTI